MRLQPVAANSLRRLVVRDIRLSNGVTLPAGVAIEMAQYSIFRNPAFGWKDPMSFVPVSPPSALDDMRLACECLPNMGSGI